ncbi:MAG: Uma2 family endonuclease [Gemmatimonadetes bacterium]|nr:Uma2 family endonuclease [Gemmatimonadota bacterium]
MGMPNVAHRWTREEVLALPDDGNRYELVDGELLVSPAPRPVHQFAVLRLYDRIMPYVARSGLGEVLLSPADLDFGRRYLVQPDLFVVAGLGRHQLMEWRHYGVPAFVAEVLSPSTSRGDRTVKRPAFQRTGVAEYWIIDPMARLVERWQPADVRPEICLERAVWRPNGAVEPFVLDVAEYFRAVWGDVGAEPGGDLG